MIFLLNPHSSQKKVDLFDMVVYVVLSIFTDEPIELNFSSTSLNTSESGFLLGTLHTPCVSYCSSSNIISLLELLSRFVTIKILKFKVFYITFRTNSILVPEQNANPFIVTININNTFVFRFVVLLYNLKSYIPQLGLNWVRQIITSCYGINHLHCFSNKYFIRFICH